MIRRPFAALAAVLLAGAAALPVTAPAATRVTLDAWGAWVRQDLSPDAIADGGRAVRLELPSGFRPESIQLWTDARPVAVRGWEVNGRLLSLFPASPLSPRMVHSVVYRLDSLRAIPLPSPDRPEAFVVVNDSDADFAADAWSWLDLGDPLPSPGDLPGRPDVNPDAPLSSLWIFPPAPRRPGKTEPLPALDGASVAAHSSLAISLNNAPPARQDAPAEPTPPSPTFEATRPEAGPVLVSVLNELDESYHRASRWLDAALQNLPAEPAPLPEFSGNDSENPENLFPSLLSDTSPSFLANAFSLAGALDTQDSEWIFPDGAEPVEWRKALIRAIVVRQRIDPATTGGYWAATRDASPAKRLRDTLLALAALETASGLPAPIPRDRIPDAFLPIP